MHILYISIYISLDIIYSILILPIHIYTSFSRAVFWHLNPSHVSPIAPMTTLGKLALVNAFSHIIPL